MEKTSLEKRFFGEDMDIHGRDIHGRDISTMDGEDIIRKRLVGEDIIHKRLYWRRHHPKTASWRRHHPKTYFLRRLHSKKQFLEKTSSKKHIFGEDVIHKRVKNLVHKDLDRQMRDGLQFIIYVELGRHHDEAEVIDQIGQRRHDPAVIRAVDVVHQRI